MSRAIFRIVFIILILAASSLLTSAQTIGADPDRVLQPATQLINRTDVDEAFDLDIAERHITQHNFSASLSVEAGEESARGLRLRVGVAVSAEEIDLRLSNVRGRVRFRATLGRVLDRINAHRASGTAAAP